MNGKPSIALVAAKLSYDINQKVITEDRAAADAFFPVHEQCEDLKHHKATNAIEVCQKALVLSKQLSPGSQLESRTVAYADLAQLLIYAHRADEASVLGYEVMNLVEGTDPDTQAVVTAHMTRAETRAAAGDFIGSDADCTAAEKTLRLLVQREQSAFFVKVFQDELKDCLRFHSQVATVQGDHNRAQELISEAKRLSR